MQSVSGSDALLHRITQSGGGPAWSPDGRELVFARGRELWTVSAEGTRSRRLLVRPEDVYTPSWSPDGGSIAFAGRRVWVVAVDVDGTGLALLTRVPEGSRIATPRWSPADCNREHKPTAGGSARAA